VPPLPPRALARVPVDTRPADAQAPPSGENEGTLGPSDGAGVFLPMSANEGRGASAMLLAETGAQRNKSMKGALPMQRAGVSRLRRSSCARSDLAVAGRAGPHDPGRGKAAARPGRARRQKGSSARKVDSADRVAREPTQRRRCTRGLGLPPDDERDRPVGAGPHRPVTPQGAVRRDDRSTTDAAARRAGRPGSRSSTAPVESPRPSRACAAPGRAAADPQVAATTRVSTLTSGAIADQGCVGDRRLRPVWSLLLRLPSRWFAAALNR
jgi:hypothetical protein